MLINLKEYIQRYRDQLWCDITFSKHAENEWFINIMDYDYIGGRYLYYFKDIDELIEELSDKIILVRKRSDKIVYKYSIQYEKDVRDIIDKKGKMAE